MEELIYIVRLGFSGADLTRALWIGLFGSLFVFSKFRVSRAALVAFIIDRIWPFFMMQFQGYTHNSIGAAIWGAFISIPVDIPYYIIRFLGLYLLIYIGYNLRCRLHRVDPMHRRKPGTPRHILPF